MCEHSKTYQVTPKARDLVLEYLKCGNVSEASRKVGYARGDMVLKRPNVAALLKTLQTKQFGPKIMSYEESCEKLSIVARDVYHRDFIQAHALLAKVRGWMLPDTTQQNNIQVNINFIEE